ncbi:MAG: toll/interleukin-1 receptor domain-containing protein [Anaerolineales bacterium]
MPVLPAAPIFISYSRRDDEMMRRVAFFLRDQGFKVWVDNEKLIPGTSAWEEAIESALKQAFAVVVILSPNSKSSEWVRREITYADQFEKRVFPVLVKGTEELSLPLRLVTRQYVDLRTNEEAGLNALAAAIHFYIGEKKTLEMKRPDGHRQVTYAPNPTQSISSSPSKQQKPFNWMLALGIFSAICILCSGVSWFGYQAFSSDRASDKSEIAGPVSTVSFLIPNTGSDVPSPTIEIPTEATTEPAPDILSQFLDDVEITHVDTFDDPSGPGWKIDNGEITNGMLEIPGDPKNYYGAKAAKTFTVGEGVVIDFNYPGDVGFEIYLKNGDYNSPNYKRFGIFVSTDVIYNNTMIGKDKIGNSFEGNLEIQPGVPYSVFIAMLPNAEFLQVMWNTDDPSQFTVSRESMDSSWSSVDMSLYIGNGEGIAYVDNYREIRFSGAK